jgi:cytochrome P450
MGDRTITIPPHTGVMPSLLTVQTHPRYWQDPLLWQPSRWISRSMTSTAEHSEKTDLRARLHQEILVEHKQSTYFPWSDGPQNCPGAKFAQVEFVAVLACILRDHRIGIIRAPGESADMAVKRAMTTTEDCDMELLLRMRNADNVHLECRRL